MSYSRSFRPLFLVSAALILVTSAFSQQPPPPPPPNPMAPVLNPLAPMGMQRGTKLELALTGTNLAGPTGIWTSFPAKVTIPTDMNNGKDQAKLRVLLEVPADAPIGFHSLRLATSRGMSNLRPFCIDDLPQVLKAGTNSARDKAQAIPIPCTVAGTLAAAETSDWYKVTVTAGQRVSFDILGRRLGSQFDPQVTLSDAKTGKDLPGGFSNDAPGLQTDSQLTYTFKDAGDYLIEIRDVTFRGGADFHYRLRVGDFPCATTPFPLAVQRGKPGSVGFTGPSVDGVPAVAVTPPTDPLVASMWVAPRGANGLHGWPVLLQVSDLPEVAETEPNNEAAKANKLTLPCGVSGRLQEKGDVDYYGFTLKKGQRVLINAQTFELNSPSEVYLVLRDAKGAQIAASNPMADQKIDYTAAADGDVTLSVEHLNLWGGPSECYHLTLLTSPEPDFTLAVALDRFDAPAAGSFSLPLILTRKDFKGAVDVSVVGNPAISGAVTIPATEPSKPNFPAGTLTINVKPGTPPGPIVFQIQGKGVDGTKTILRPANFRTVLNVTMGNLPNPPPEYDTPFGVAIKEQPPFSLAAKLDALSTMPGQPVTVTVTATRLPAFADEIVLSAAGLPPTVKVTVAPIAKGTNEVKIKLEPAANVPAGNLSLTITGKGKHMGADVTASAVPLSVPIVVIPFELKAEPAVVAVAPGAKAKFKVTATRKTYQGPLTIEIRNLPANVTATKPVIAQGQVMAEVELTAAANAVLGDKADVQAAGIATAAANDTRVSPNFTVSVKK